MISKLGDVEIIHIASELAPVAKVGGLGDVIHGLSRALLSKKESVKVILPKYDTLDLKGISDLKKTETDFPVHFDGKTYQNTLWEGSVDKIPVIFIDPRCSENFFTRGQIYECQDDILRFMYFCVAALTYLTRFPCDVVHLHDWHTALIACLLKTLFPKIHTKVILTIHNLAYQGLCQKEDLQKTGWVDEILKSHGKYNLLKGGVLFADQVTTVSPTYAKEVLSSEGDLQDALRMHRKKITGVLNGIDSHYWDPASDHHLPFHYSFRSFDDKKLLKKELKKRLFLADEDCPLVGTVTRLVPQKGPELIKAALLRTLEWGGQFVLLGSSPDPLIQSHFSNLKRKLKGNQHVHFELAYNEALSHLFYAAADVFLVPSLFEPCGLTQQIAMRYGAVPVVRKTGGLADTVFEGKNGFTFGPPTSEAIDEALDRAFEIWYKKPELWKRFAMAGMCADYSWNKPAEEYLRIYKSAIYV